MGQEFSRARGLTSQLEDLRHDFPIAGFPSEREWQPITTVRNLQQPSCPRKRASRLLSHEN